ncbi:TPA: hypothetical protein SMM66_003107 [Proteus mirabilis]|nr:hypothetical protein [Proteus mirabilis]
MYPDELFMENLYKNLPNRVKILGLDPSVDNQLSHDGVIKIELPNNNTYQFNVEIKLNINKQKIMSYNEKISYQDKSKFILISNYLTPKIQYYCIDNNINFIDSVGNIFIQEKELYLYISGRKGTHLLKKETQMSLGIMKLLFILLSDESNINLTYRELADLSGISLGMVNKGMNYLKLNNLYRESGGHRRFIFSDEICMQWINDYGRILRPKLKSIYLSGDVNWLDIPLYDGEYWGGEAAASKLTNGYLIPENIQLFTPIPLMDRRKALNMIPVQFSHFQLVEIFWGESYCLNKKAEALLSVAELVATQDERNIEIAKRINEQYLHIKNTFS